MNKQAKQVLEFWFNQQHQAFWFAKNNDFDGKIRQNFLSILKSAMQGECESWRETTKGRLAEIIVLDQFSRNIYRDMSKAFSQDGMALILAQMIVKQQDFIDLSVAERNFALMPFMHSESQVIHNRAVVFFEQFSDTKTLEFELKHKIIIDEFGRYPHRNSILGRQSTQAEIKFLQQPNSSF